MENNSLSKLLEKLEAKYPDDQDVMAVAEAYAMESEEIEDPGMEEEVMSEELAAEPESASLDDLFAEDMAVEGEEEIEDMPMPKKKRPI